MEELGSSLTWIDLLAAIVVGFGAIRGLFNGFIKEIAGLIGVIIGIWAGFRFAFIFAEMYRENAAIPEKVIPFIAFLSAFVVAMALVLIIGKVLKFMLKKANLSLFDKAAGALFGTLKMGFIVGTLVSLIGKAGFIPQETKDESYAYPILTQYCEAINEYTIALIPKARNVFTELDEYFNDIDVLNPKLEEAPEENSPIP